MHDPSCKVGRQCLSEYPGPSWGDWHMAVAHLIRSQYIMEGLLIFAAAMNKHSVDLQFRSSDWGLLTRHPGKSAWWFSFYFTVTLTGSFLPWSALSVLWKSNWWAERYSSWVPGSWGPGDDARSGSSIPSALASWACLLLGSEPCLPFGPCGNIPLSLQEPRARLGNGYLGLPAYQPWLQNIYV